jgi:hypothetical protein
MYIDPNSGGMLFQVLIVVFGLLSGMVLIFSSRIKWAIARLKRSLREKSGEEAAPEPGSEPD